MLLGLLCSSGAKNFLTTFTFGIPNCDDARFAKELSSRMKVPHQFLELKPDYLLDVSKKGVMLTDGFMSCYHLHALANAEYQAQKVRIIYGGYYIDSLISSDLQRNWVANYDDDTSCQLIYNVSTYIFKGKTGRDLFTDEFRDRFSTEFDETFRAAAMEAKASSFLDWFNQFDLRHRARRFDENGNELLRGDLICRTPFCDKDLIEFTLALPPGFRLDRLIFIEAIARLYPTLAKVPWDKTGFPLMPCGRDLALRFDQQLRWQLRKYGLEVSDRVHRPYADYNTWMRTILRNWVEETLLSKRALERGYFNPSFVRNLVMAHMRGENHARELGMLLSMEMWHKQYLD
jgi:asparagine synthase (glutamine-hydrolysing)